MSAQNRTGSNTDPPLCRRKFVRWLREQAAQRQLAFSVDFSRGKGSHGVVRFGSRRSTLPKGDLKRGTQKNILKQLGLDD